LIFSKIKFNATDNGCHKITGNACISSIIINASARNKENQYLLQEKKFQDFYKKVLNKIGANGNSIKKGLNSEMENFKKSVSLLNYKEISEIMTLINSQNYTLFLPFKIDITQYKIKEFENMDNSLLTEGFLDGSKVWDRFKRLNEIENFSEMKVKKSRINSLMQFFTFNIIKYDDRCGLCNWTEDIGGIYYIRDYQDYLTDDLKFKRKEYQEDCSSNFY
jgi:CRISPR-associated endonuclease/helicase Cas3